MSQKRSIQRLIPPGCRVISLDPRRSRIINDTWLRGVNNTGPLHYDVPTQLLEAHLEEVSHRYDRWPASPHPPIEDLRLGRLEQVASSDFRRYFHAQDETLVMGTVTPMNLDPLLYQSLDKVRLRMTEEAKLAAELGQDCGLPRLELLTHHDRSFHRCQARLPAKLNAEQLKQIQRGLIRLHAKGFAINSSMVIGLTPDGVPVHLNLAGLKPFGQEDLFALSDAAHLNALHIIHGVENLPLGGVFLFHAWQRECSPANLEFLLQKQGKGAAQKTIETLHQRRLRALRTFGPDHWQPNDARLEHERQEALASLDQLEFRLRWLN